MGSWSTPPSRCLAPGNAPHEPQGRATRAPCVYGPRPSVRGGIWRGVARILEQKMIRRPTHASHQPQATLATQLPRHTVAGPPAGLGTQQHDLGLVSAPS